MASLVWALNTKMRANGRASVAALTCKATSANGPCAKQRGPSKAMNWPLNRGLEGSVKKGFRKTRPYFTLIK
jgi:hypothetical protein